MRWSVRQRSLRKPILGVEDASLQRTYMRQALGLPSAELFDYYQISVVQRQLSVVVWRKLSINLTS